MRSVSQVGVEQEQEEEGKGKGKEEQSTLHFTQGEDQNAAVVLSKKQIKRLNRQSNWLEGRSERRKIEREKRKLKRKALAQERQQQQQQSQQDNGGKAQEDLGESRHRYKRMANSKNKFRVVIDMDFEDYMTESELKKSVLQLARIYAANRHSDNPCQLYISSIKGKVQDMLESTCTGYTNWDINSSHLDYVTLFECDKKTANHDDDDATTAKLSVETPTRANNNFIYLSGDSDVTLSDVDTILKDESVIFIIGGLVDRNRHKNLCHKRALERGIPTARLPIKESGIVLSQRHILATLTVFEIMLQVLGDHKSWPEVLISTIPKRKIAQHQEQQSEKQLVKQIEPVETTDVKSNNEDH